MRISKNTINSLARAIYLNHMKSLRFTDDVGAYDRFELTTSKKAELVFSGDDTYSVSNSFNDDTEEVFYYDELQIEGSGISLILKEDEVAYIDVDATGFSIYLKNVDYAVMLDF